jgi:hypothetical protein
MQDVNPSPPGTDPRLQRRRRHSRNGSAGSLAAATRWRSCRIVNRSAARIVTLFHVKRLPIHHRAQANGRRNETRYGPHHEPGADLRAPAPESTPTDTPEALHADDMATCRSSRLRRTTASRSTSSVITRRFEIDVLLVGTRRAVRKGRRHVGDWRAVPEGRRRLGACGGQTEGVGAPSGGPAGHVRSRLALRVGQWSRCARLLGEGRPARGEAEPLGRWSRLSHARVVRQLPLYFAEPSRSLRTTQNGRVMKERLRSGTTQERQYETTTSFVRTCKQSSRYQGEAKSTRPIALISRPVRARAGSGYLC